MPIAHKGEVWMADLGMVAKVRPCLILTDSPSGEDLAIITVCHHTTSLRFSRWEVVIEKPFLKEGAFHLQQINTINTVRLMRKLGDLTQEEWDFFHKKFWERFSP
jgi:mRNA interferase MazF